MKTIKNYNGNFYSIRKNINGAGVDYRVNDGYWVTGKSIDTFAIKVNEQSGIPAYKIKRAAYKVGKYYKTPFTKISGHAFDFSGLFNKFNNPKNK